MKFVKLGMLNNQNQSTHSGSILGFGLVAFSMFALTPNALAQTDTTKTDTTGLHAKFNYIYEALKPKVDSTNENRVKALCSQFKIDASELNFKREEFYGQTTGQVLAPVYGPLALEDKVAVSVTPEELKALRLEAAKRMFNDAEFVNMLREMFDEYNKYVDAKNELKDKAPLVLSDKGMDAFLLKSQKSLLDAQRSLQISASELYKALQKKSPELAKRFVELVRKVYVHTKNRENADLVSEAAAKGAKKKGKILGVETTLVGKKLVQKEEIKNSAAQFAQELKNLDPESEKDMNELAAVVTLFRAIAAGSRFEVAGQKVEQHFSTFEAPEEVKPAIKK